MQTLSAENLIYQRMQKLGVANDFVGKLSGIPGPRLSRLFRGIETVEREKIAQLSRVISELETLVELSAPLPLRLDNPDRVRPLLERVRTRPQEIQEISKRFDETQSAQADAANQ